MSRSSERFVFLHAGMILVPLAGTIELMIARTELEIVWDGPVKGLAQHRVSLTRFGSSLDLLMKAARRIASQKLQDALESTSVGRLVNASKNLDIELASTKEGSGGFSTLITFEVPDESQSTLFNQLPELVGLELLESIRSEAEGTHRNVAVRNYLRSLPEELTRQDYRLHENGREITHVELRSVSLPEEAAEALPAFYQIYGRIAGVGFEPRSEVKVRGDEGSQMVAIASAEQVNVALEMRSENVSALAVAGASGTRLIVLASDSRPAKQQTLSDIFDQWSETYRALA